MTSPTPRRKVKGLLPLVWSNTLPLDASRPTYFICTRLPPCASATNLSQLSSTCTLTRRSCRRSALQHRKVCIQASLQAMAALRSTACARWHRVCRVAGMAPQAA